MRAAAGGWGPSDEEQKDSGKGRVRAATELSLGMRYREPSTCKGNCEESVRRGEMTERGCGRVDFRNWALS